MLILQAVQCLARLLLVAIQRLGDLLMGSWPVRFGGGTRRLLFDLPQCLLKGHLQYFSDPSGSRELLCAQDLITQLAGLV